MSPQRYTNVTTCSRHAEDRAGSVSRWRLRWWYSNGGVDKAIHSVAGLLPGHLNNEDPCSGWQSINLVSVLISFRQAPAGTLDLASAPPASHPSLWTRDTRVLAERAEDRELLGRTKRDLFVFISCLRQWHFYDYPTIRIGEQALYDYGKIGPKNTKSPNRIWTQEPLNTRPWR